VLACFKMLYYDGVQSSHGYKVQDTEELILGHIDKKGGTN